MANLPLVREAKDRLAEARGVLGLAQSLPSSDPTKLLILNEVIRISNVALPSIPTTDPIWCVCIQFVSTVYMVRWSITADFSDLKDALWLGENGISHAAYFHGVDSSLYALYHGHQCGLLNAKWLHISDKEDLQSAIEHGSVCVSKLQKGDPRRTSVLTHLATSLRHSYELSGSLRELDLAILYAQEAYNLAEGSESDLPELASQVPQLALSLGILKATRFERENEVLSLDLAIGYFETAIDRALFPIPTAYSEMGNVLVTSYKVLLDPDLIGRGITLMKHGADLSHPSARNPILQQLGAAYLARLIAYGREEDRRLGMQCFDIVLGDPKLPNRYRVAAQHHKLILSTFTAIESGPSSVRNFQNSLLFRAKDMGLSEYGEAIESLLQTLRDQNAPVVTRVLAGENAITLDCNRAELILKSRSATQEEVQSGKHNDALDSAKPLCREVVDLLTELAPYLQVSRDQQYALGRLNALPATAAAMHLSGTWEPHIAWDLLERGASVTVGITMSVRRSLFFLDTTYPELSSRYRQAEQHLRKLNQEQVKTALIKTSSLNHLQAVYNLEQCAEEIRQLDGFSEFLLPPKGGEYYDGLDCVLVDGPIVAINVYAGFCTAMIITKQEMCQVSLPQLKLQDVVFNVNAILGNGKDRLCRGPLRTKAKRNSKLREILRWLWRVAVKPVFTRLGFLEARSLGSELPHMWWHASGLAGLLPFHAAGEYEEGSEDNALSHAYSSYTPTIKALKYASTQLREVSPVVSPDFVVVSMPETPDGKSAPLPNAVAESDMIKTTLKSRINVEQLISPSRVTVLSALDRATCVHLACHGVSDPTDPSLSHLKLYNSENGDVEKLTVQDLRDANDISGHAKLAYLSACSTTKSSRTELSFESVHLASAFQLLGFSQVVGTMWQVTHDAAETVATEFYRALALDQPQPSGFNVGQGRGVRALFRAIEKLKAEDAEDVLSWVPFVHFGAYDEKPAIDTLAEL